MPHHGNNTERKYQQVKTNIFTQNFQNTNNTIIFRSYVTDGNPLFAYPLKQI